MAWNTKIIEPKSPTPPKGEMSGVSPALTRFFGAVGFVAASLGTMHFGSRWLLLPPNFWSAGSLSGKALVLIASAFVFGFLGMVFAWGAAASITVRSEAASHVVNVLWHYLANGTLIWFCVVTMVLTKIVGRDNAMAFMKQFGEWRFAWTILGLTSAVSLLSGVLLLVTRQLRRDKKPQLIKCWIIVAPVSFAASYQQFMLLQVETLWWLMLGAVFPPLLIAVSAWTIERDRWSRERFSEKHL
jgi:hypothetical protein